VTRLRSAPFKSKRFIAAMLIGAVTVATAARAPAAEQKNLPVPATTIFAGEVIREEALTERGFAANMPGVEAFFDSKAFLIGRAARRALLPGQPIPNNAVEDARVVSRGVPVKIVLEDRGLIIVAYGTPLQSGGVGSLVRVRNVDTGVVVMGVVQADGTIRVSNG
jgi:flagellar basal body P-ring formation protein FlgA